MKILIHSVILLTAMIACYWVAVFCPPFWQATDAHDVLPRGANLAVLVFAVAILLRGGFRWSVLELLVNLLWSPFLAVVVVFVYLGESWSHAVGSFSPAWLLTMSIFVGAPWLLGVLAGSLILRCRNRLSREAA